MVEDIHNMFLHIGALSIDIRGQPYTVAQALFALICDLQYIQVFLSV